MTTNNKPIQTLRDGMIKATIWKNFGEKGNFHNSDSFSGSELLRVANLAKMAYDRTLELRQSDKE